MGELHDAFALLLDRQPSDAEQQHLYRVRDALGLRNNDALWLVLIALQYYQSQYEQFPQAIAHAATETLRAFQSTAEATAHAAAASAHADLADAVATVAQEVAHHVAGKQKTQWLVGSVLVSCLAFLVFGWSLHHRGHQAGYDKGYGVGYSVAQDEKAAAAWANTPEGQVAYRFAQVEELQRLAKCQGKGWAIKDKTCYPFGDTDRKVHGWRIP